MSWSDLIYVIRTDPQVDFKGIFRSPFLKKNVTYDLKVFLQLVTAFEMTVTHFRFSVCIGWFFRFWAVIGKQAQGGSNE